ncbi:MAG: hypothetical protein ONB46_26460 [candidate division KSB1 bacterium]|nr:hypothetical protein [candidate division KSB1 bacterium]MDZ7407586.1 hypothetical protein [candidate division KSB1 bacterium]
MYALAPIATAPTPPATHSQVREEDFAFAAISIFNSSSRVTLKAFSQS